MAIKLTTQYLSENEFLYDVAQSTGKFDTAMYEQQKELGTSEQYAQLIAGTLTTEPKSAFDNIFYDKLSSEDKLAYITQKYYTDVDSDQYKKNEEYFKQKEQEIKNKEIYEGLSGFEKAAATTAGWVGTALNSVLGIAEGVVDFLGISAGQLAQLSGIPLITGNTKEVSNAVKEFIAKDITGYAGVQKALNNYTQAYTFIDKNGLAKGVNDIAANLGQYATVFIPVVGPALFWTSIAGNTAEQNIHSNPDIDWSSLMLSTGLTVGVEGLTEYLGGKLFPDDIISSKLFGANGTGLASTLIEKVGINFLSEGLEEGVAEFLGSLVRASLVTGDEKDVASFKDILYASLIGGIMGAGATTITSLATTPKYSVINGELVETATLSKEEKKLAKNLGFRGSYELINQIDRTQQVLQQPTAIASLMTKYGTSLSDIRKNHSQEYQNAVEEDIAVDEKKTDMVLDLSNLLQTIGIDQFVKSAELLNENVDKAREMVDNFLNHTDTLNKQASAVFSKHFPDQTFTPQQTTSQERVVTEGLRKVFPQYKFVFGKYGSKNGQPIRQINVNDKNKYVFIESGLVDKLGVEQTISRIIRQHIAQDVMARIDKLPANKTDALVTLITDKAVKYKDLTESQKRTIAQIICFDPIKNKKVFNQSKQVHQDVFNYITKQAGFVRDLGVRNKTNQIRYRDLLKIRETFMTAISRTVYSNADIQAVRNKYNLTEDELNNKIVFKTRPTILNKNAQLMNLDMTEQGNAKHTATQMLLDSRLDTTVDFDWNRLYDSTYYTTNFVESLMQNEKNMTMFEPLLREYINNQFNTELDLNDRDSLILFVNNNMSSQEIQKSAQIVLTDEFVQANKDSVLNSELGSMLYTLSGKENVVTEQDGIILTSDQIQGTGKLKPFINLQLLAKKPTFDSKFAEDIQPYVVEDVETEKQVINNTTLYKGVTSEITDDFDNTRGDKKRIVEGATWLTDNIEFAKTYANMQTGGVLTRTVTVNNPLVIDAQGRYFSDAVPGITADDLAKYAQEQGYDSLIIKNIIDVGPYLTNATDKTTRSKPSTDVVIFKNTSSTINKVEPVVTKSPSKKATDVEKNLKQQKSVIRKNAKTQKIKTSDLLANKEAKNKYNELNKLVSDEKLTAYQGEHDQQTIITTSRDIYQDPENQTFFENLTSNDYQAIRRLLLLDQTMESDARMALLDVYAYEHRNTQFKDIKDFITYTYQRMVSGGMRYGGLSNSLYGSHAVSSLVSEIETDTGNDIEIPVNIVENALSKLGIEGQTVQEYQTYLHKQVTDLEKQLKQTKDPYDKYVLRDRISELQHLLDTIDDEDFSGVLDAVINMLNNKETDVAKNQEAISEIHQKLIAYVLQHSKMGPNNKIQTSKSNSILSPEAKEKLITGLMAINSFRYMCMLSSTTTMARNAVSNTAISVQAIAEDAVTGKFEKSGLLATESQVSYVGEYNEDFSKYIDKEYGARIDADTEGDKYTTTNVEKLRNQYAQEKDPLKRNKITAKIKELEQKGLSDKPWTKRRTLRNLKNMFAGAKTRILFDCESWLIAKYRNSTPAKNMTQSLLIERITNAEIKNLYKDAISDSNTSLKSTIMLGEKLKIDLCDKNSENSIYKRALYRSNKLLFKTDNWLSNTMRSLRKSHPVAAELLTWLHPFMKVAFNTTLYAIDRSPVGIAKGVIKTLQTRTAYISDMKRLMTDYYRQQYREANKGVKDWSFDESKFNEWFEQSVKTSVRNALISNKYADIKQVYDTMVDEGLIPRQALGSDNPYMRAEAFEALGQGIVGTSLMTLGLILAAVTGAFDYDDDDDYLGPVIRIGDLKIALDDLTPFTTMFTVGAMLGSNNIDNSIEAAFKVFVDQTMFSVIDSAIVYSDDLGDFFGNQIINTVQQFIPAITKGLSKSIYNAKPDKSGNWFEKLIKTTGGNLITFGWAVPRKINPYTGEKLPYYESGKFEGFVNWIFPIQFRIDNKSTAEKEAIRLGAETTGLSGKFNINTVDYVVKDKEKYAKYRADYIESQFNEILNGKQQVTVEDENGKRITTTYDKLNDKQKKNVINRLYTDATAITKIRWWTDQGNAYVVTDRDLYNEYRTMFNNIIYKKTWTKSKFVES